MDWMQKALDCAVEKAARNQEQIGSDLREFRGCPDGQYFEGDRDSFLPLSHIFNWTQSFFTGESYWAYRITKDETYLKWMYQFYQEYYDKVFQTPLETMHDTGFLYTPYAVALYEATGDPKMKELGVKAADELAKRFEPNGGYIRAWGRMDGETPSYVDPELAKDHFFTESRGLAIIDCMMNLALLFWAGRETGHPYYTRIAQAHADTTLRYFVREDDSVCHAYRFDEETGEPLGVENYCGFSKESHWARGTAWAVYGYAIAYDYTKKAEYLDTAVRLARKFVELSGKDGVPIWDFRLPADTPAIYCGKKQEQYDWDITKPENTRFNLDTSAAAIVACGILEIVKHREEPDLKTAADTMLTSLCEKYVDYDPDVPGLLSRQNGNMTYTSFGDYFLMEALSMRLHGFKRIW